MPKGLVKILGIGVVFLILLCLWLLFSGVFETYMVVIALLSCAFATYLSYKMLILPTDRWLPIYLKINSYKYFLWLAGEVFKSGLGVSKRIWQLKPDISPVLSWIKISQPDETRVALHANSITLTPGTVCVNAEDNALEVHVLTEKWLQDLEKGEIGRKIKHTC